MSAYAIIPAYEPSSTLLDVVAGLNDGFNGVIVVDDGSRHAEAVFNALKCNPRITVLRHDENHGKGIALKTAFQYVLARLPDVTGVVTVDADGQHLPEDAVRVANAIRAGRMILGTRQFRGPIPLRSRIGNFWTIGEFQLLTGRQIRDTQSGLRGFPRDMLEELIAIPGSRYEYEITTLVRMAKRKSVDQVPIATVYEPGNPTSHYRALKDTFRTQFALFAAALTKAD